MERSTLWTRMGDWIKHPRRSLGLDDTLLNDSDDAPVTTFPSKFSTNGNHDSSESSGPKRQWPLFGGNRKLMEDQHRQVSELVQSLQTHVQRQTEVTQTANHNLERLIDSLSAIPSVIQAQQQALTRIQNQLESQPNSQKQVQEVLTQLGGIRDAVKESSTVFNRYSETSMKSQDSVVAELQKQSQAVTQLAQATDPVMHALTVLRSDVGARGEELAKCVTILNTKLVQFACAALILALIATIIGIVAFFR